MSQQERKDDDDVVQYQGDHPFAEAEKKISLPVVENPFRHQAQRNSDVRRVNFPSFEEAMGSGFSRSMQPSNPNHNRTGNMIAAASEECLNRSADSSAGNSSNASSLNLSIGALAALNEHLRHIAFFGLDESHCNSNSNSSIHSPVHGSTTSTSNFINTNLSQEQLQRNQNARRWKKPPKPMTPPRNPLDGVWNSILESTSCFSLSPALSSSNSSCQSPPALGRIDTMITVSSGDVEGVDAIEVSSRVVGLGDSLAHQQQQKQH